MARKIPLLLAPFVLLMGCTHESATPVQPMVNAPVQYSKSAVGGRAASPGVVYVSSQGLYYDTFVSATSLPHRGRFQKLYPFMNGINQTDFGPGDPGYLGGRWWVDVNMNGVQDDGDMYLLCPLLPPGRPNP